MRDAIVEAMAVAIVNGDWDELPDLHKVLALAQARKALSALEGMGLVVGVWRDIASAPKERWQWVIGSDGTRVAPMCWMERCDDDEFTGWCGASATDGGTLYCNHVPLGFDPTHWLPLPAAPSQKGGE